MSRPNKRYNSWNPVKKRQEQSVKSYGPFITYVHSLTFIKNALAGCFFTGITAVTFIKDRSPGWYFIPLLIIVFLKDKGCIDTFPLISDLGKSKGRCKACCFNIRLRPRAHSYAVSQSD